jgi:pimeloyl-ACP methyl ester carboxylesterase
MQRFDVVQSGRKLAYREFGDPQGHHIVVCLPGILEDQSSFDAWLPFYEQKPGVRLITVDLCGRGHSDWLAPEQNYSMQLYSDDLKQFLSHIHATHPCIQRKMFLVGTSMGALLAMHLASDPELKIEGIVLNDVALSVSWMSLYSLHGKLQTALTQSDQEAIANELNIDPKLLSQIGQPHHLDIPHRLNYTGLSFHRLISQYKGKVMLVRGADSEVCTYLDHLQFIQSFSKSKTLTVSGAAHPVAYNEDVIQAIDHFVKGEQWHFDRSDYTPQESHVPQQSYRQFVING